MKTDYFFGLSTEGFHRVAYREWGIASPSEIPVICVHGMTRNSCDFNVLADYLSNQGKHLYCVDVVGRGNSDWLKNYQHYTFEQYTADMNALIARTGASQVDWVGTSMGGLIGMLIASMPNSPIRRLIINDIGPQIPAKTIRRLASYGMKNPRFNSQEEAKAYYKAAYYTFGNLTDDQWERITQSSIKKISPNQYISKVDPGLRHMPSKGSFIWKLLTQPRKALEGICFDVDLWHIWRNVKCPVYLIHGQQSDLLLPGIIDKMHLTHPGMKVLEITNVGHAPVLEDRNELETIMRWLSE